MFIIIIIIIFSSSTSISDGDGVGDDSRINGSVRNSFRCCSAAIKILMCPSV